MQSRVKLEPVNGTRKPRQDKGKMRWTERDLAVVRWIGEQYAMRMDQLAVLLACWSSVPTKTPGTLQEDTVYKLVKRWERAGVVETTVLLRQQPNWVWLTREGLEQMDLPYRFWGSVKSFVEIAFQYLELRIAFRALSSTSRSDPIHPPTD